MTNRVIRCLCV